jgi:DNA adenine methylase
MPKTENPPVSHPIKRHGGKSYQAKWIVGLMPPRCQNPNDPRKHDPGWMHFVEPYFGAGNVLFALDPVGISEVANDIDGDLTNFFDTLKSPLGFPEFRRLAALTPVSEIEFDRACQDPTRNGREPSPAERALAFFIRNRQSRQALEKDFVTPVRRRTRRGMQEHCSAWLSAIDGLAAFHARLQRVLILNRGALDVIGSQDDEKTLFYCDPPYVDETRTAKRAYQFEMTLADHRELLETLAGIRGRFLLSGYHHPVYDQFAQSRGWHCTELVIDNKAAGGSDKRTVTEVVWTNYPPPGK